MKTNIFITCFIMLLFTGCGNQTPSRTTVQYTNSFLNHVLNDPSNYYYFDFKANTKVSSTLPIGMFDSGTGGLTVLRALVDFDQYNNSNQESIHGGDGINDFKTEQFIYFGDQANMPYGNYSKMNKTGFLKELVLKDALFLLGNKYFRSPDDKMYQKDKETVKLIVIACNTATAYGKEDIEDMLSAAGSEIKVIGVIDAGVRGALTTLKKDESGTVGVFATAGTVASDGYLNAFNSLKTALGYTGNIQFVQQAGTGIAEAIDEEPSYIERNAKKTRPNYKGPSLNDVDLKIHTELMKIYNFDTTDGALLCDSIDDRCNTMQINSPENYVKYHLVSLCEQLRMMHVGKPLKTLILGCTHYPYLSAFIQKSLKELHQLKIEGKYIYKDVLCDSVILIDPAINTAKEVYEYLASSKLLNKNGDINKSEFFMSVPDNLNVEIKTDSLKRFTYEYKYGRNENHFYDTKQVPVSRLNTNDEIISRFQKQIPSVLELIIKFDSENDKTRFLMPYERF
jgi:glutamate racemase